MNPRSLQTSYVLNAGGFVNHSFRVADDIRCYHLKLANNPHSRAGLLRWQRVGELLERYRAPTVLQWIDVGAASGLLFPCVAGSPPRLDADILRHVLRVTDQLNHDVELAAALQTDTQRTAHDVYLTTYHERFLEDLEFIRNTPPPFVPPHLVDWMSEEAERLARLVADSSAFDQSVTQPVHGDLWLNNILWRSAEEWHIVDWDGVALGDPMIDLAMLTGPSEDDVAPLKLFDLVSASLSPMERARLEILGRASLLDWIIDPLSDWIDADVAPAHTSATRAQKERIHRAALALYQQLY